MSQRLLGFGLHACVLNFCETNIRTTCRECGAGEGLHGRSHRTSRRRRRRRPDGRGKGRWHYSAVGEIVGRSPVLVSSSDVRSRRLARSEENLMSYSISAIDDIDADEAKALKSVGIRTTEKLLEVAKNPKGRKFLATK